MPDVSMLKRPCGELIVVGCIGVGTGGFGGLWPPPLFHSDYVSYMANKAADTPTYH